MLRYEILNAIAERIGARRYLEIGVQDGIAFRAVDVPRKVGVDPDPRTPATFHQTSDEFFRTLPDTDPGFDLVFVDGLHTAEQVRKDIANAIRRLRPGGAVVAHDCSPPTAEYVSLLRCGTTYRGFVMARADHPDVYAAVVDSDLGCGIFLTGGWAPVPVSPPLGAPHSFEELDASRKTWLNLISVDEFRALIRREPPPNG